MARAIAYAETDATGQPFSFGLALLAAWVAAVLAVVAMLCGFRSQKSSTPKGQSSPPDKSHHGKAQDKTVTEVAAVQQVEAASPESDHSAPVLQSLPLPLPPGAAVAKQQQEEALHPLSASHGPLPGEGRPAGRAGPRRGLSMNLNMSMKLPEGLTRIRTGRRNHKEDSLWMKTIILGEKCRVPDEDGEDSDVRDEKGNPHRNYQHMTSLSMSECRTNSFSDKESANPSGK